MRVGKGDVWEDVPFTRPPAEFTYEWRAFADCIARDIEPPTHGPYARHIMEILFAAEQSAITGQEVMLESGTTWTPQASGTPIRPDFGWV